MKVLGRRVDGLTVAFRTSLDPLFLSHLRERGRIAMQHGRAAFTWRNRVPVGSPGKGGRELVRLGGLRARHADEAPVPAEDVLVNWGVLGYSNVRGRYHITNEPYFRLLVAESAAGAVEKFSDVVGWNAIEMVEREDPSRAASAKTSLAAYATQAAPAREGLTLAEARAMAAEDPARVYLPRGQRSAEAGWTVEIVFYAQWLAEVGVDAALREAESIASLCGEVHEMALRRFDLCVDVQDMTIEDGDINRFVKRPRALSAREKGESFVGKEHEFPDAKRLSQTQRLEAMGAQDYGAGALGKRSITGLSVGRGGALMARIYDKRCELAQHGAAIEERRATEEKRWLANGWDGESGVTRVEFQIRGDVIKEFGLRDPYCALEAVYGKDERGRVRVVARKPVVDADGVVLGLVDRLDYVWKSCLDWVRLVDLEDGDNYRKADPNKLKPSKRLSLDPRWELLHTVSFTGAAEPSPIKRVRVRGAASAAMGLGVSLSQAARDGLLEHLPEQATAYDEATALDVLVERVQAHKLQEALRIIDHLLTRAGDAVGACVHYAVRNNAAMARYTRRLDHADLATGPPDGDGPRSYAAPRGGGLHVYGDRLPSGAYAKSA